MQEQNQVYVIFTAFYENSFKRNKCLNGSEFIIPMSTKAESTVLVNVLHSMLI